MTSTIFDGQWFLSWTPTAADTHVITVQATDYLGEVQISAPDSLSIFGFTSTPTGTAYFNPNSPVTTGPTPVWGVGDIFTQGPNDSIVEVTPGGQVVRTLQTQAELDGWTPQGGAPGVLWGNLEFDRQGDLFSADVLTGEISEFGPDGKLKNTFDEGFDFTSTLYTNGLGTLFTMDVGVDGTILAYNAFKQLIGEYNPTYDADRPGIPFITGDDPSVNTVLRLGSDQHTVYFLSWNRADFGAIPTNQLPNNKDYVASLDLNTGVAHNIVMVPGLDENLGEADSAAVAQPLPNGDFLIEAGTNAFTSIFELDPTTGQATRSYNLPDGFIEMGDVVLDPDGTSFWINADKGNNPLGSIAGGDATLFRFNLADGSIIEQIDMNAAAQQRFHSDQAASIVYFGQQLPSNLSGGASQEYTYQAHVSGFPANDPVTYSLAQPTNARIDRVTGLMTWTPEATGNYAFTSIATDSFGEQVSQQFTVNRFGQFLRPIEIPHSIRMQPLFRFLKAA